MNTSDFQAVTTKLVEVFKNTDGKKNTRMGRLFSFEMKRQKTFTILRADSSVCIYRTLTVRSEPYAISPEIR